MLCPTDGAKLRHRAVQPRCSDVTRSVRPVLRSRQSPERVHRLLRCRLRVDGAASLHAHVQLVRTQCVHQHEHVAQRHHGRRALQRHLPADAVESSAERQVGPCLGRVHPTRVDAADASETRHLHDSDRQVPGCDVLHPGRGLPCAQPRASSQRERCVGDISLLRPCRHPRLLLRTARVRPAPITTQTRPLRHQFQIRNNARR